jgi:CcmD family protein
MNFLLEPGIAIYIALAVALVVWIGIFAFLWRLDGATRELRRRLDSAPPIERPGSPRATLEKRGAASGASLPSDS